MGIPIEKISDHPEIQKILRAIDTQYGKVSGDGKIDSYELDQKDDILSQQEMDALRDAHGGEIVGKLNYPDGVLDWTHVWRLLPNNEYGDYQDDCTLAAVEQALFRHGLIKEFRNQLNLEDYSAILSGTQLCLEVAPQYFISEMIYLTQDDLDLQGMAIDKAQTTYISDFRNIDTEELQLLALDKLNWHELVKGDPERQVRWIEAFLEYAVSEKVRQRFLQLAAINLGYTHGSSSPAGGSQAEKNASRNLEVPSPLP